jgi:hypothetical protein
MNPAQGLNQYRLDTLEETLASYEKIKKPPPWDISRREAIRAEIRRRKEKA